MRNQTNKAEALLSLIRRGEHMTFKQQLELTIRLSIPAVVAQISYIVMQYIDASMVGSLGAELLLLSVWFLLLPGCSGEYVLLLLRAFLCR